MFKLISKRVGFILCLMSIFVIVDNFFKYTKFAIINNRSIFGLLGTNSVAALVSLVALALLWIALNKYEKTDWLLILITAATLSNILDRIFYGGVVDYFNLPFIPTFNLADVAIIIGLALIAKTVIKNKKAGLNI